MPVDDRVVESFLAGVTAVSGAVEGWADADWARPACGIWTGTDLAGHLVTVVGWYYSWLDRALAGDASPAFPADELTIQTAAALDTLPSGSGPDRVAEFDRTARRYAARVVDAWEVPYGYPRGTVTAGLHAALASWEWHVHASDLARTAGRDHRPADAALLYGRGMDCFAVATGTDPRVDAPADAWLELLRRTGREV